MTLDELCSHLLPPDEHLHFETLLFEDNHLTLMATMTAAKAVCPDCHQPSQRIHSGYPRTLADLPWATMPVELRLQVRRFFCDTPVCERTTFTEGCNRSHNSTCKLSSFRTLTRFKTLAICCLNRRPCR